MSSVLLDTHTWVWSFADEAQLSEAARAAIVAADAVHVSPISFFEIGQKIRLGKWPEMEPFAESLPKLLSEQGGYAAPLTAEICLHASMRDWSHRDPFDRLLASTAESLDLVLISKDPVFAEIDSIRRLW